jgi:hypothetical protein
MRKLTGPLALALVLGVAACSQQAAPPTRAMLLGLPAADNPGMRTVNGHVLAPAGVAGRLITNDGAGIVAQGAGNLISNDGGSRHVEMAGDRPLAGARVWLTDAGGVPLPGVAPATSGPDGSFRVPEVPMGARGLVRVEAALPDGRPAWLECPLDPAVPPRVDLASTLATAALRLAGGVGKPVDARAFTRAVATFQEAPPAGAVAALADPTALGHLAAGIVLVPTASPAPGYVDVPTAEAPAPEPSLVCARMQPKLGAPPTTICTPLRRP